MRLAQRISKLEKDAGSGVQMPIVLFVRDDSVLGFVSSVGGYWRNEEDTEEELLAQLNSMDEQNGLLESMSDEALASSLQVLRRGMAQVQIGNAVARSETPAASILSEAAQ